MRKYFLLSAVALLTATNVNAESMTYTVEAQAKVALSAKAECTTWDWGTIYLTDLNITDLSLSSNDYNSKITASGADADKFTNIGGYSPAKCEWVDNGVAGIDPSSVIVPDEVHLVGNAMSSMLLTDIEMNVYGVLSGTLKLDDVYGAMGYSEELTYKGSFVMTAVY